MVRWAQSNVSFNTLLWPKLLSKFLKKIEDPEIGGLCYLYSNDRNFRLEHFSIFCQIINVYFILLWNISKWLYANLIVLFVWTRYEVWRKKVCTQSWFKNKQFFNKIKPCWVLCMNLIRTLSLNIIKKTIEQGNTSLTIDGTLKLKIYKFLTRLG